MKGIGVIVLAVLLSAVACSARPYGTPKSKQCSTWSVMNRKVSNVEVLQPERLLLVMA